MEKQFSNRRHKKKYVNEVKIIENIEQVHEKYGKISAPNVKIGINDLEIKAAIDSAADTNIISSELVKRLGLEIKEKSNVTLRGFNGTEEKSLGKIIEEVKIGEGTFPIKLEVVNTGKKEKLLIGIEWLKENKVNLNLGNNTITLVGKNGKKCRIPVTLFQESSDSEGSNESEVNTEDEGYKNDNDSLEEYGSEDSQFNDTD